MKKLLRNDPFYLEYKRAELAVKKDFSSLESTYASKFPEIPDRNTSKMWSVLNETNITHYTNPMAWERVNICAKFVERNSKVLDIGFGSGIVEELILKRNINVKLYGIDIAKRSVQVASKKFSDHEFKVGSILELPYKDNFFDYVLALEILEHVQPRFTFSALAEIYRVLKPKSFFIVSVPLNEGLEQLIKEGRNLNAHVRIYTPELIMAELSIAGFILLKKKYLHAFHTNYKIKSFIALLFENRFPPNNLILLCQKN